MATYTSTQTGLWNDSATWGGGGYPDTADDIANVRHKVEYNITDSGSPFLGDVNIQWSNNNYTGHLAHQTGTYLNLNGRLNLQGGNYEMADDVTLAFTGNNSPDHGVYIYNGDRVSFYANGSSVVNETRMSTSGDVGDYYIPVEDASNFQTGDWISVYFRYFDLKSKEDFFNEVNYPSGVMQGEGVLNTGQYGVDYSSQGLPQGNRFHNATTHDTTEGFIIHDINSNDIYVRDLVGPDSSITAATTSKITVANSKVFREGQRVIFGTGSKRTASKITNINYQTHRITLEDNLSSIDVIGEKVYLGALKIHKHKRTIVRTVGNQVTSEAAASATTITLNNVSDYSVGDKFYVEHQVKEEADWDTVIPNNTNSWYQDIQIRHEITGISGNTLTFTPALPYKVYSGAFTYKANRRITIKGASDDPTDGTCKPFFYSAENGSQRSMGGMNRYRRKMILKDVQFLGLSNSSGTYQFHIRGGFNDGYWRYSHSPEGLVIDAMGNNNANYVRLDGAYYGRYLNITICNWLRGFYSGREYMSVLNSTVLNCRRPLDSFNVGNGGKAAYIRCTRGYENIRAYNRSNGQYLNTYQIYAENESNNYMFLTRSYISQCHFICRFYPIRSSFHPACKANYIKIDHISSDDHKLRYFAYLDNSRMGYYSITDQVNGCLRSFNYEYGNDLYFNGGVITYDNGQGAYLCRYASGSNYNYPQGYREELVMRPNETIKIKASVKIHEDNPNSNWTYRPYLIYQFGGHQPSVRSTLYSPYLNTTGAADSDDDLDFVGDITNLDENILYPNHNYGQNGSENYDAGGTDFRGHVSYTERDQFDSKTSFVEQTITITNKFPYEATLTYGLCNVHDNANYGWYFKPFVIARDQSETLISKLANRTLRLLPAFMTKGTVANRQKKRIGGARL